MMVSDDGPNSSSSSIPMALAGDEHDVDSEFDWPSSHALGKGMMALDKSLRCPICHQLMKTAQSVSTCGHTFCSLCIRTHLVKDPNTCPACKGLRACGQNNIKSTGSGIQFKPCPAIQEAVATYLAVRQSLLQLVTQHGAALSSAVKLKEGGAGGYDFKAVNDRERPKTYNYQLLKDDQLKKILQDNGLPLDGKRDARINRYKQFVVQMNSELDKGEGKARPKYEVVKKVLELERQQQQQQRKVSASHAMMSSLKPGGNIPASLEQNFKALVSRAKKQMKEARKTQQNQRQEEGAEVAAPPSAASSTTAIAITTGMVVHDESKEAGEPKTDREASDGDVDQGLMEERKVAFMQEESVVEPGDGKEGMASVGVAIMRDEDVPSREKAEAEDKERPSSPSHASMSPPLPQPTADGGNAIERLPDAAHPLPSSVADSLPPPLMGHPPAAATQTEASTDPCPASTGGCKRARDEEIMVVDVLSDDDGSRGADALAHPATTTSGGNGWTCPSCTFKNVTGVGQCEVCGLQVGMSDVAGIRKRQKHLMEEIKSPHASSLARGSNSRRSSGERRPSPKSFFKN